MKTLHERLWRRVSKVGPEECWEWQGMRLKFGHGMIRDGTKVRGVHRVAFEFYFGPIPDGLFVCHTCDNPPCCNPAHLFLGTPADNSHDRDNKGRSATGGRNGRRTMPMKTARGEMCGRTKLTTEQIIEIRARYLAGGITQRKLAAEYGITHTHVGYIAKGYTWKHLS